MPKSLDTLYGKGTSKAFAKACGGTTVEAEVDNGTRVYVEWGDGSNMKIDCSPETVHFHSLDSKREGLYTDLCNTLPAFFKERGVKTFTAQPANAEAEAILRRRGGWDEDMRWSL